MVLNARRTTETITIELPNLTKNEPLATLLPLKWESYELNDYDANVNRGMVLNDEVLLPFLIILKEHLKDLQEVLGSVDD